MPQIEQDEKTRLQKKIQQYNLLQVFVMIPMWLPGVMDLLGHTPTAPYREIYVLMFRVGMAVFSLVCFAVVGLKIQKMKALLVKMEIRESRRRIRVAWRHKDQANQAFPR